MKANVTRPLKKWRGGNAQATSHDERRRRSLSEKSGLVERWSKARLGQSSLVLVRVAVSIGRLYNIPT